MNSKRSGTVVAGGIAVALLGMLLVFVYAGRVKAGAGSTVGAGTAFVATSDIPVGTRWEDMTGALQRKDVPGDIRPVNAITSNTQLNGKSAAQTILKGQIITSAQFNVSSSGGLDIPAGQNAVTINLGTPQGVARYVQPGAEANVYVSYKGLPGTRPEDANVTKLVLSNIKVLANEIKLPTTEEAQAAAAAGQASPQAEILLTMAVTPDQAERLIFAKENGSIWLGLVNPGDAPVGASGGRTFRTALI
ncbi:MAG: Flp pilus assembly protein CpaB [Actinomycetota bacterium]